MSNLKFDVEDIRRSMNYVKKRAHKQHKIQGSSPHNEINQLIIELGLVNQLWNVNPEFEITSHRPVIGKFIVFGKKVVRKLLRWYVTHTFHKQQEFNASVTRTFNILYGRLNELNEKLNEKNEEILMLHERIQQLEVGRDRQLAEADSKAKTEENRMK